jgi:predicted DNA-binding transcriptional regulator AlpA
LITNVSRPHRWRLERENKFPRRVQLGPRSVGWRLSEVLALMENSTGEKTIAATLAEIRKPMPAGAEVVPRVVG